MILNDVCKFIVDCPHSTSPDEGMGYPLIRTPNIGKGRLILDNVHRVSEKVYHSRTVRAVPQDDDLIFAREAPAGNIAIIKNGEKVCLGQRTVLLRPDKTKVYPDYLVYYLLAPQQQHNLLKFATGATVPHINLPDIRNLQIELPPYTIQIKKARTLSAYDDLIENNNRQIKLLEEAAQRLYKEWFIDLRFPGHESTKIEDGVPEGWEKSRVCNVISIIRRGISPKYSENGTSFVINQKCIRSTIMDISSARRQEKKFIKEMNLCDEDIVICSTGAGTLGRVGKVFGEYKNTTFDSHITLIRASQDIGKEYLFHTIKSKQKYLQDSGKGSTNQLELKKSSIEDIAIFIPKKDIYDKFETIAYNIHKKITSLSLTINYLKKQKMILLSNIFTKI